MKIIIPKTLTDSDIVSSNISENEYPTYSSTTLYLAKDKVISNHKIYQAIVGNSITGLSEWSETTAYVAGNKCYVAATFAIYQCSTDSTGQYPPNYLSGDTAVWTLVGYVNRGVSLSDTNYWIEVSPTNYYAMFDSYTSTQSSGILTDGQYELSYKINASKCSALALFNCSGKYVDLSCESSTGKTLWSTRVYLYKKESKSWSDYFFSEPVVLRADVYQQFPRYYGTYINIKIVGPSQAACGTVVLGALKDLGLTKWSPTLAITDYSKKETNDYGVTYLSEGKYKKKVVLDMYIDRKDVDLVYKTVAKYRATPIVYVCDNSSAATDMIEAMLVYGFYNDFSIVVSGPVKDDCSLTVESLV